MLAVNLTRQRAFLQETMINKKIWIERTKLEKKIKVNPKTGEEISQAGKVVEGMAQDIIMAASIRENLVGQSGGKRFVFF